MWDESNREPIWNDKHVGFSSSFLKAPPPFFISHPMLNRCRSVWLIQYILGARQVISAGQIKRHWTSCLFIEVSFSVSVTTDGRNRIFAITSNDRVPGGRYSAGLALGLYRNVLLFHGLDECLRTLSDASANISKSKWLKVWGIFMEMNGLDSEIDPNKIKGHVRSEIWNSSIYLGCINVKGFLKWNKIKKKKKT